MPCEDGEKGARYRADVICTASNICTDLKPPKASLKHCNTLSNGALASALSSELRLLQLRLRGRLETLSPQRLRNAELQTSEQTKS